MRGKDVFQAADPPHATVGSELIANIFNRLSYAGLNIIFSD